MAMKAGQEPQDPGTGPESESSKCTVLGSSEMACAVVAATKEGRWQRDD
jgi:hypothetical protein